MRDIAADYFRSISEQVGRAWNRFWFLPSDPLTLCVIRVLAGLIAFYSVATFTPDLIFLFGPDGLLSIESVGRMQDQQYFSFSYFWLFDSPGALWAAHWIGLSVLAMFTLGLFTRITSVLSLIVALAYFHRGFVVTSEMEPVLAFVLFYLCLGPAGEYFSLDRLLLKRRASATPAQATSRRLSGAHWSATVAVRLIQVHLALVYFMMVLGQLNEDTWWDGTAVWWLAGRQDSALISIASLASAPYLVNLWTLGFVIFEIAFGVLAWNRLLAPLMVGISALSWLSIGLVTGMLPFAAIMFVAGLAFLPPETMRVACDAIGLKPYAQPVA